MKLFLKCQLGNKTWLDDLDCHTFLSKCLSKRVSASVSPPGHTAEDKPSVSKPTKKKNQFSGTKMFFI